MNISIISQLFSAKSRDAGWLAAGIAANGVCFAQVKLSGGKPRVVRCEYLETGQSALEILERLKRDANLGNAVFTTLLASGEYQMLLVEAPPVPDSELKTAIRWKIKDSLSYPVEDAGVDVLKIPVNASDNRPQSVYVIAAPNHNIKKQMSLFEEANLELRVIEVPETAQRNVAAYFEKPDRALALLVFNEQGGLLTFTSGGELYLSRRIEITAAQLSEVNEGLRAQYCERVELELQRSLDYFDRQFNYLLLSRVLLCAPEDPVLLNLLDAAVAVPVEKLDLSEVMDISAVPSLANLNFMSRSLHTLGAALRHEKRVK